MTSSQFTTAGLTRILNYGLSATGFPYIAVGTGSATFALALNAMGSESLRLAILDSVGVPNGGMANQRLFLQNSQAVATLTEAGGWDASSNGNLLWYKTFAKSFVKTDDESMIINTIAAIHNLNDSTACLTSSGLAALRGGGVTGTTFPYIAVCSDTLTFDPTMTDTGTELARGATTCVVSTNTVTISRLFAAGSGTGTWNSYRVYDAASGGNLLAAINRASPYVKAAGTGRTATITLTLANEA